MKNKNKHLGYNYFEKNKDLALFESKFVYTMKRDPNVDYEESTPNEDKLSAAESIISQFNERFAPGEIPHSGESVDTIVHGVRHSLMQGPLADLNAEGILNERVRSKLEWARRNAPEHYKHIIDEMARAEIGDPGLIGGAWNVLTRRRRRVENEVARELFTFNMQAGEDYETLTDDIELDILGLGIVNINGTAVNFGNANEVTTFTVAPGPNVPSGKQVIIDWNNHDYDRIKRNLEAVDAWEPFTATNAGREWMQLKFRHSLLTKFNNEEKAKLSSERYDKERLEKWLKIDTSRLAMQDPQYLNWVEANSADLAVAPATPDQLNYYTDAEDMLNGNPVLYNELQRNQMEAEQRSRPNSLEGMLRDILHLKHLDELEDTVEMKALLAYLQAEYEDDIEGPRVHQLIMELAGRARSSADSDELNDAKIELRNFDDQVNELENINTVISDATVDFNNQYQKFIDLTKDIIVQKQKDIDRVERSARGGEALGPMSKELSELMEQSREAMMKAINEAWAFLRMINMPGDRHDFINNTIALQDLRDLRNTSDQILRTKPNPYNLRGIRKWLNKFHKKINNIEIQNEIDEFKDETNQRKITALSKKSKAEEKVAKLTKDYEEGKAKEPQKMDPRGLLYKLVVRDLEERGLSAESNLQKQALFATNALIAQSRHHEIYGHTNKNVARALEGSWFGRMFRNSMDRFIPQGWTSVMSTKEILGHVVDSDPDLIAFSRINVLSSRKDLMDAVRNHGNITPEKLRSMQEKLALFIAGVEVPSDTTIAARLRRTGEKVSDTLHFEDHLRAGNRKMVLGKRFRVRNDEAPMLENVIHLLSLVESQMASERSLKNIDEDIKDKIESGEELNRSELQLKHLEEVTEASQATDKALEDEVDNTMSPLRRRLMFKSLRQDYYQAMEETRGMPWDERDAELTRLGFSKRVRSKGIFSMRARWWTKEIGKGVITLPFKGLYHGARGIGKGISATYKYLFGSEIWKKSTAATHADIKSILRAPLLIAYAPINYSIKILAALSGRPLDKAAVKSINKSYANINQETNPQ